MTDTASPPQTEWRNLFGVCAAIGEDFGLDPLWLRIAFASATIFWPVEVFALYFALGAVALVIRLLAPNRPAPVEATAPVPAPANSDAMIELREAA